MEFEGLTLLIFIFNIRKNNKGWRESSFLSEKDDFIFIPSKIVKREVAKGIPRGGERVPYGPDNYEVEWMSQDIEVQITSTISSIQQKQMKDLDKVFLVLGLSRSRFERKREEPRFRVFDTTTENIFDRLSADVLAYLNEEHNKLLISCPMSSLVDFYEKRKHETKYFQQVNRLGPLLYEELVSSALRDDATWIRDEQPVLIQLIPNLPEEDANKYLGDILGYLESNQIDLIDYDISGFIFVNINKDAANNLLDITNFIYNICKIPIGITEKIDINDVYEEEMHYEISERDLHNLPSTCVMDSGINDIKPLRNLVVRRDGYYRFQDYNDGCFPNGHGTPIACLASFGEYLEKPKSKIISYKIYSDQNRTYVFNAIKNAFTKYSPSTRIFLSSITFEENNFRATANLDHIVQASNICMIMSAGNIQKEILFDRINNGSMHPAFLTDYPVNDPATGISFTAIGAISKEGSPTAIARINDLAPFSRCGTNNLLLFECPKPEIVQNGGNCCYDGTVIGGLTSYDRNGQLKNIFIGTSFSAPIFAARIAEIESKYGDRIRNAETLKVIALASSEKKVQRCRGFGETCYFCDCDRFHALLVSEGELNLPYTSRKGFNIQTTAEISVRIPKYTKSIELLIVHSDNFTRMTMPSLNTYLKVYARKTGNESGYVNLVNPSENKKKSHMKLYKWQFRRKSMEGDWTFIIKPEVTAEMLEEHRQNTSIRFGCAIFVTSKMTSLFSSLTQEMDKLLIERIR